MATPRETLKYYFRKYALPTEQQFAELIDAFVHKDEDMLTQEKIDGLTAALESKVSTETLDQYKAEVQAMIDNATTGGSNISDRLDTAEDNIAGHELRIKALEQAEGVTIDEYLSNTSKNPVQNKTVFSALEEKANQTEFQSLKEKIDTFLEDTDATDETINKWKEIESFLQGITDTKTLAGLLSDLKAEIIALIPEPEPAQQGNFVKQVADLDGYSEAQDGEIVQYVGQTSENYTRGFFYERKAGEGGEPVNMFKADIDLQEASFADGTDCGDITGTYHVKGILGKIGTGQKAVFFTAPAKVGDPVWIEGYGFTTVEEDDLEADINYLDGQLLWEREGDGTLLIFPGIDENTLVMNNQYSGLSCYVMQSARSPKARYTIPQRKALFINKGSGTVGGTSSASWQVIPVGPCVG